MPEDAVRTHQLSRPTFQRWLAYLGIGGQQPVVVQGHLTEKLKDIGGHPFISGWGSPNTPSITANSSDQQVRIPGIADPHSIVVHPSPELFAAVGWQSPINGAIEIGAAIADAHPECGNGIEWFLQHHSGNGSTHIDQGNFATGGRKSLEKIRIEVVKGDLVSLIIGPRDREHSCDLTSVNLVIDEVAGEQRTWDLADQVSPDILNGNPHSDSFGHDSVWHLYSGPVADIGKQSREAIPENSLLAQWTRENDPAKRDAIALAIQELAQIETSGDNAADSSLKEQLDQIVDPASLDAPVDSQDDRFGRHPESIVVPDTDLFMRTPETMEFHVPADFASEGIFSVDVELASASGNPAVQVSASLMKPEGSTVNPDQPILVRAGEAPRQVSAAALDEFRSLFPAALCYTKIVPVDEVVTLQLYYREDDHLKRLMCDDAQQAELDRLWDELLFIAEEPLASEDCAGTDSSVCDTGSSGLGSRVRGTESDLPRS